MKEKRKCFKNYNLNDLLTIYQFLCDFYNYNSNIILLDDIGDEISYRIGGLYD